MPAAQAPAQDGAQALADRAARLHAAGLAASDNGRPASAVRTLRAGLRLTGQAAPTAAIPPWPSCTAGC